MNSDLKVLIHGAECRGCRAPRGLPCLRKCFYEPMGVYGINSANIVKSNGVLVLVLEETCSTHCIPITAEPHQYVECVLKGGIVHKFEIGVIEDADPFVGIWQEGTCWECLRAPVGTVCGPDCPMTHCMSTAVERPWGSYAPECKYRSNSGGEPRASCKRLGCPTCYTDAFVLKCRERRNDAPPPVDAIDNYDMDPARNVAATFDAIGDERYLIIDGAFHTYRLDWIDNSFTGDRALRFPALRYIGVAATQ